MDCEPCGLGSLRGSGVGGQASGSCFSLLFRLFPSCLGAVRETLLAHSAHSAAKKTKFISEQNPCLGQNSSVESQSRVRKTLHYAYEGEHSQCFLLLTQEAGTLSPKHRSPDTTQEQLRGPRVTHPGHSSKQLHCTRGPSQSEGDVPGLGVENLRTSAG